MVFVLKASVLAVCLCILQVKALNDLDYRRALQALRILEREDDERRALIECKSIGEECDGVVNCCGDTQCYWKDGYSAFQKGECVTCVSKGNKCQRDSQCCDTPDALQCEKGNVLWVDGNCEKYRSSGECYRDGQCVHDCKKKWPLATHGFCE